MSVFVLETIASTLPRFGYRFSDEAQLHNGIAKVLDEAGIEYEHEKVAGPKDRFDFFCSGIVIEAKIHGSFSEAMRQADRYLAREDVAGLVLVTTRHWGKYMPPAQVSMDGGVVTMRYMGPSAPPATLRGKPIRVIKVRSQAF